MALSRKKSRLITVNWQDYRWQYFEDSGYDTVTIQSASGTGSKLITQIDWVLTHQKKQKDNPNDANWHLGPAVTPASIEAIIKQACAEGWQPNASVKPVRKRWAYKKLVVLS